MAQKLIPVIDPTDRAVGYSLAWDGSVHQYVPEGIHARVLRSTAQTITTASDTDISFDTQTYDPQGFWGSGATITIPTGLGGLYVGGYDVGWDSSSATGYVQAYVFGPSSVVLAPSRVAASASFSVELTGTFLYVFADAATMTLRVRHTKGSNRDTVASKCQFWLARIGPA